MTDQHLRDALEVLARVGREAGLDEGTVRAEGMSLAAAVMETSAGPSAMPHTWAQTFARPVGDYFEMVPKGRRYTSIPTVMLQTLLSEHSPLAAGYAQALTDIATAACSVPGAPQVAVGRATSVAQAQLSAAGVGAGHPGEPDSPAGGLLPPEGPGSGVQAPEHQAPGQQSSLRDWSQDLLGRALDQQQKIQQMLGGFRDSLPPAGPVGDSGHPAYPIEHSPGLAPDQPGPTTLAPPTATQTPPEAAAPQEPEPEPEDERSVEELLAELDELIGLDRVKAEIHRQVAVLKMDARRQEAGLKVATLTRHLVFTGNPGTGKTTVARLVGGIYKALGLLSKGQLVEVDRSELVAGYLGQTAAKTAEVVASALGGVLFIDEAYSLNGDQYGKEAVDTLVKEMEDHRDNLVVIVAGYPEPMAEFVATNPGLESRFRTHIEFADYTDEELVAIQHSLAAKMDYDIADEAEERFREILAATPRGTSFGNGRFARNMLEAAIGRHAWRLRDAHEPSVEDLRTLERIDFEERDGIDLTVEGEPTPDEADGEPATPEARS